jgi:hypothetical protein
MSLKRKGSRILRGLCLGTVLVETFAEQPEGNKTKYHGYRFSVIVRKESRTVFQPCVYAKFKTCVYPIMVLDPLDTHDCLNIYSDDMNQEDKPSRTHRISRRIIVQY